MTLYHPDVYMPKYVQDALPTRGKMRVTPSEHAIEQAKERGFTLPGVIDFSTVETFEVLVIEDKYTHQSKLTKVGYRVKYDEHDDLCMVINTFHAIIVTAWLNNRGDYHATLYADKYSRRI